jgi:hypothetical protein
VSPTASGNAYSRDAVSTLLPVPEADWRLGADLYLLTRAPFHGAVIAIDNVLGLYRMHGDNASSRHGATRALGAHVRLERQRQELVRQEMARVGLDPLCVDRPSLWLLAMEIAADRLCRVEGASRSPGRSHEPAAQALRRIWTQRGRGPAQRVLMSGLIAGMTVLPRPLLERLVPWLVWPQSRPAVLDRLL